MRKPFIRIVFLLSAGAVPGCVALTYPTITDSTGEARFVVNTKGKAHVRNTLQKAHFVGGQRYEQISFIDQKADGTHRLTSYQRVLSNTMAFDLHSDTYCNPDWTGCAFLTNDYDPDNVRCSVGAPGVRLNLNCLDTIVLGWCYGYRPGECGRGLRSPRTSISDLRTLLDAGVESDHHTLSFTLSSVNTKIHLVSPGGSERRVDFAGSVEADVNLNRGLVLMDLSSIVHQQNARALADLADSEFADGPAQIDYNGVTKSVRYSLLPGEHYRDVAGKLW